MFGYILCDKEQLSEAARERYRSFYCGLCRTLRSRYGLWAQAALNFDMTFLCVLLAALYEPRETIERGRCAPHPFHTRKRVLSEVMDYGADMTVLLAYYNALDDWHDDKSLPAKLYAGRLQKAASQAAARYPQTARIIVESLEKMNGLERAGEINLDAVAGCFGEMLAAVFVMRDDHWADKLRRIGTGLGRFIYFMDAYEDADRDSRHKNYNPLLAIRDDPDYETRVKEILTMFLADAAAAFETLPIVTDAEILRNILYAGVWSKYSLLQEKKR